jgi:hypothetical protein
MFNYAFLSGSLHPATALRNRVSAVCTSVLTTYASSNLRNTEIWAMLGVYKHFGVLFYPEVLVLLSHRGTVTSEIKFSHDLI